MTVADTLLTNWWKFAGVAGRYRPGSDHRANVYSFGCLAFEVLTGRPPFNGRTQKLVAAHMSETPKSARNLDPMRRRSLTRTNTECRSTLA